MCYSCDCLPICPAKITRPQHALYHALARFLFILFTYAALHFSLNSIHSVPGTQKLYCWVVYICNAGSTREHIVRFLSCTEYTRLQVSTREHNDSCVAHHHDRNRRVEPWRRPSQCGHTPSEPGAMKETWTDHRVLITPTIYPRKLDFLLRVRRYSAVPLQVNVNENASDNVCLCNGLP